MPPSSTEICACHFLVFASLSNTVIFIGDGVPVDGGIGIGDGVPNVEHEFAFGGNQRRGLAFFPQVKNHRIVPIRLIVCRLPKTDELEC